MDGSELLRSRNRFKEVLPSGLNVTLRLPRIDKCIVAGAVPLPVLEHVAKAAEANGQAPDVSAEEAAHMLRFQDEIIRASVVEIEGEPVSLTADDVDEFTKKDRETIVAFGMRIRPLGANQT